MDRDPAEPLRTVAALYVDLRGPYPRIPGVIPWGLPEVDATLYEGPYPIVAHPPCGPYSAFKHLYRGSEHHCAPRAVEQVREFGGVLEHPLGSRLWGLDSLKLPFPGQHADGYGGLTIEVDQVRWGHVAHKRTWLYLVRVDQSLLENPPPREPTHDLMGARGKNRNVRRKPGLKEASAELRRRTPKPFAEYLLRLARSV